MFYSLGTKGLLCSVSQQLSGSHAMQAGEEGWHSNIPGYLSCAVALVSLLLNASFLGMRWGEEGMLVSDPQSRILARAGSCSFSGN